MISFFRDPGNPSLVLKPIINIFANLFSKIMIQLVISYDLISYLP